MKKIEVLQSIMNIKNEKEYEQILYENNIKSNVVTLNQVDKKEDIFRVEDKQKRLYSYNEKGISKSRNKLLELASGDICIFADDDTKYVSNYEEIIENAYKENSKADVIVFFVENINTKREKNKKIRNKKINFKDVLKVRIYEVSMKKETVELLQKKNIKFDINFGPGGIFKKGEETVFVSKMLKNKLQIYSVSKKIGIVQDTESTWFTGFNEKFLYDQGAIFYKIFPKIHKLLILQYVIRKYFLYRKNVTIFNAYKQMCLGAKKCKEVYKEK